MSDVKFKVKDDGIYKLTPVRGITTGTINYYQEKLLMSREAFIEAMKKWKADIDK